MKLIVSNSNKPTSYTAFVLPFHYRPVTPYEGCCSSGLFAEEEVSQQRRDYFTKETSHVLFERARWLAWKGPVTRTFQFYREHEGRQRAVGVERLPPRMVLFEWSAENDDKDALRVGFLILHLRLIDARDQPPLLEDLLDLNESYRYCERPYPGHEERYASVMRDAGETRSEEDLYVSRWRHWLTRPVQIGGHKYRLCTDSEKNEWKTYSDSRAFVWTCAILDGGTEALGQGEKKDAVRAAPWIKLLNVDAAGKSDDGPSEFEKEWAGQRTYVRWAESGTLYGFNYHSGAMIAPPETDPPLWRHFAEMYFDQTLLLLYGRVALFRYSKQLSEISSEARRPRDGADPQEALEVWQGKFQDLRWSFALFCNLYGFPLLSNQQQGIEMYTLAREHMDVREFFEQMRQSIENSHEFLQDHASHDLARTGTRLTVLASVALVPALATGIWGMNILVESAKGSDAKDINLRWELILFLFTLAVLITLVFRVLPSHLDKIARCLRPPKERP